MSHRQLLLIFTLLSVHCHADPTSSLSSTRYKLLVKYTGCGLPINLVPTFVRSLVSCAVICDQTVGCIAFWWKDGVNRCIPLMSIQYPMHCNHISMFDNLTYRRICPEGFTPVGNKCYIQGSGLINANQARAYCESLGANQAAPIDKYEMTLIIFWLQETTAARRFHLGFRLTKDNVYDISGGKIGYTYWADGHPNDDFCCIGASDYNEFKWVCYLCDGVPGYPLCEF